MKKQKIKTFRCYSYPLKNFLLENGLEYLDVGKDHKTDKTYWIFVDDEDLTNKLKEWSNRKLTI
ncbi:MAG: hypothetical protein U0L26_08970 [Cellulosilyticum sp.]|nr:hypothetical protein [Cellulosilyticum sp.]